LLAATQFFCAREEKNIWTSCAHWFSSDQLAVSGICMLYVALWADSLTDALRQRMALELIPYEQSEEWKALLMFWSRFPRRLRDLSSLNFFQSVAVNCVLQSCKVRIAARAFRKRFAFR